jgi:hypothetical protein
MERSEFDAFTADDARVKATEEPNESRRAEWLKLAAAIDMPPGATAGDLPEELRGRLYEATGAATADITIELLARALNDRDPANAQGSPDEPDDQQEGNYGR